MLVRRFGWVAIAMLLWGCASPAGGAVRVHEPGTGDHALRWDLEPGDEQHRLITVDMDMATTTDSQQAPHIPMAAISLTAHARVLESNDDAIELELSYDDVTLGDKDTQASDPPFQQALDELERTTSHLAISTQGGVRDISLADSGEGDALSRGTVAMLQQQLAQLVLPFPREPVGVGARWTAEVFCEVGGLAADATYSYTLVELDRDRYVLEVEFVSDARAGTFDPGGEDLAIEIVRGSSIGAGQIEGSLQRALPDRADIVVDGSLNMRVLANDVEQLVAQHSQVQFQLGELD